MRNKISLLTICLFVGYATTFATRTESRSQTEACMLALDFQGARNWLLKEQSEPYRRFYAQHILFLEAFIKQENQQIDEYFEIAEKNEPYFTNIEQNGAAFLAYLYFERATLKFLQGAHTAALGDFYRCRRVTQKYKATESALLRFEALFEIGVGSAPKKYQKLLKILGIEGNVARGLAKMGTATQQSVLLPEECDILLYYVHRNVLSDYSKAGEIAASLYQKDRRNPVYGYLTAHNALDKKDPISAREKSLALIDAGQKFPFIYYHIAKVNLYTGDYENAAYYFNAFLYYYKGNTFRLDAAFKRAMAYLFLGDKTTAIKFFKSVNQLPQAAFDEDAYARKQAAFFANHNYSRFEPNLWRARFYFDGGNYEKAAQTLDAIRNEPLNEDDRSEWNYRYGRIYQETGRLETAKKSYLANASLHPLAKLWTKAYAYFYAGKIARSEGDAPNACAYFNKALAFENYDYENALTQRAAAEIEALSCNKIRSKVR